ncbi:SGNH/GDSL hydrolase family protein [Kitasatospora sp. NPDC048540]|uniref:SGNH/GDSL hydrolase family protein n=1 Tax=unclassified Kitasatospora TaxID=2633591 RepID=UPI000A4584FB|nr:SGNH/GDSL hydrolase family protein [Kitasatospora sp. MBT63]
MRPRLLAVLVALPLLLAVPPAAAAEPVGGYAALGDSYAAGVAAGPYDAASGDCHRGAHAYPALWNAEHHPAAFTDAACSAATTADVLRDQLPAVPADTALVTLTAGGNDLAFADAVASCLPPFATDAQCDPALEESDRLLREELPGRLAALYDGIRAAAPAARVVVTGYPYLLHTGTVCVVGTDSRRARFNALTDRLDELIRQQAEKQGFAFADVRRAFAGHGVCAGGGQEWITRFVLTHLWESFHPTATGQSQGYLPAVTAAAAG